MSYYVTLPSNGADLSSDYGKIHNTLTDFEIELRNPLEFPFGNYEVGLSEFSYRKTWEVSLGWFSILFDHDSSNAVSEVKIIVYDGMSMDKVIKQINKVYATLYEKLYTIESLIVNTNAPYFELDTDGILQIRVQQGLKLVLHGYFVTMLKNQFLDVDYRIRNKNTVEEVSKYRKDNLIFESSTRLIIKGHNTYTSQWQITSEYIKYIDHLF